MRTLLLLSEKDNVLTCTTTVKKGDLLNFMDARITALNDIPVYHKIAGTFISAGSEVYKYGETIGRASKDIHPGEHVHVHNLESLRGRGDKH